MTPPRKKGRSLTKEQEQREDEKDTKFRNNTLSDLGTILSRIEWEVTNYDYFGTIRLDFHPIKGSNYVLSIDAIRKGNKGTYSFFERQSILENAKKVIRCDSLRKAVEMADKRLLEIRQELLSYSMGIRTY